MARAGATRTAGRSSSESEPSPPLLAGVPDSLRRWSWCSLRRRLPARAPIQPASRWRLLAACACCRPAPAADADPDLLDVRFTAAGRRWSLRLHAAAESGELLYRGVLRGDGRSAAEVVLGAAGLHGVVASPSGVLNLQPAADVCREAGATGTAVTWTAVGATPPRPAATAEGTAATPGASTHARTTSLRPMRTPTCLHPPAPHGCSASADAVRWTNAMAAAQSRRWCNKNALAALGQENLVYNMLNQTDGCGLFFPYDVARDPVGEPDALLRGRRGQQPRARLRMRRPAARSRTAAAAVRVFGPAGLRPLAIQRRRAGSVPSATNLSFPARRRGRCATARSTWPTRATTACSSTRAPGTTRHPMRCSARRSMSGLRCRRRLNKLNAPEGVFVDSSGALWVAEPATTAC